MSMEFEWDQDKQAANLAKHDIDFLDAATIWRDDVIDPAGERIVAGEYRPTALGIAEGSEIIIAVVYTVRGGRTRIISARRARRNERKDFQDRFGRGR